MTTPLPDSEIQLIHAGLMIPNDQAVERMAMEIMEAGEKVEFNNVKQMAREIRRLRGYPNPDLV